ncbi:carbohydrate ABC transporter permease [Blastopirellula sp. JC732]|uniref:Carbohydrate ABC transporter permease n=1 Tax=Blastopirellula sediminis TaxID=2894196 RepID=A0A9X1MN68_9BACT|nr:carbohydrate ABC transporter permease [Blastopirellula sediminis]MCC9607066.1 carbohydrate ABC transporter permease [Blastopirellula sediminis]MCC9629641.1 carbohydrate ABC transporter permease [Blastopirellula sediminis]
MKLNLFEKVLAYLALLFAAILLAGPLLIMAFSSLKTPAEIQTDPHAILPQSWRWKNYQDAVSAMPFFLYLRNTLLICIGSVIGTVISCSMTAYAFSKLNWPGRNLLFGVLIGTMLLPWHVTMIPRFLLLREVGLYNTLGALIIPTFLGDAFSIFLLRQFFRTIPEELSEAARIDGLSEWGIFWRIVLPLSKPAIATVALFQFIAAWNDFSGPLLLLSDKRNFPLAYGLEQFVSSYSDQTHLLLAAATLFTLPIVVLFFLTQRTFLKGIATTGLK